MGVDLMPKKKVGVFAPRAIVENGPFEFYQLAPPGIALVIVPMGIREFTPEGVDEVYKNVDAQLEELMVRGVDLIVQEGVPLQCLIGCEAHDQRLAYIHDKTGLPVTSGVLGAVEAAKHLGVEKIAFGNKFTDQINESLTRFFTREGIEVTGYHSWGESSNVDYGLSIKKIGDVGLVEIGYEVGRRTFEDNPDADAIYMPGGSWALNTVITDLEAEYGKPVLGHRHVGVWEIVKLLDMWTPQQGLGRLFASP